MTRNIDIKENTFSGWLKTEMAKNEMAPKDLAKRTNVTVGAVYAWMRGDSDPSPQSRKKIVEVFEKAIPKKVIITTPLFGNTCKKCEFIDECKHRVVNNFPIMCMSITIDDIIIAVIEKSLDILIWWEDITPEDYEDLDGLVDYLNRQ